MELLVALGKVFGAERLINVESAHVSGVSFKNLDDAGLDFLEEQVELGAKARIKTTLNPSGMDLERWQEMGIPQPFAQKQLRVIEAFRNMGVELTCTCTPYLVGHTPQFGSQISWAESSAVAYSNSVLGCRTNRESGPSTLASSITGKSALYGYRLERNRVPRKIVKVEARLESRLDYSALGFLTGRIMDNSVPYFQGIRNPDLESLKALGAACATSGGIALYHIEGVTPEARQVDYQLNGLEQIILEDSELEEAASLFSSEVSSPIVCLGCPHCSIKEMEEVVNQLKNKDISNQLWLFTSRKVYDQADRKGYLKVIEKAGGKVFRDTCMVVAPLEQIGWKEVATNSFKCAQYLANMGFKTQLRTTSKLLGEA